ncbi:MAG: flagellar biosynthesis protein FliQ [Magnetococcales bacterium]|nr:flagellar biosynthesis protein FliQ [Magnetococcales bacterium]
MTMEVVLELVAEAVRLALLISAPMLLTALAVGLLVSLFQAVTQIQEMTLTFIPKILATFTALILALPWMLQNLIDYFRKLFDTIPTLIG